MRAHRVLLQRKYARVIEHFAEEVGISLSEALGFFYSSVVYEEMSQGLGDMHCRADGYLVEDLAAEWQRARFA